MISSIITEPPTLLITALLPNSYESKYFHIQKNAVSRLKIKKHSRMGTIST
jgi:hypothetical protein